MALNLNSTDYPKYLSLTATGDEEMAPYQGYGFSTDDLKRLKELGVTVGDLQNLGLGGKPEMETPASKYTSGGGAATSGGGSTVGGQVLSREGRNQLQNATMLKLLAKSSGAQQPQQPQAAKQTTSSELASNPDNLAAYLGAAALGNKMIIGAKPGPTDPKSGVGKTTEEVVSSDVPTVSGAANSWDSVAKAAGLGRNDIAEFQKAGMTPDDVAKKFNVQTAAQPWTTMPSVFNKAATPAPAQTTPITPAAQPLGATYNPNQPAPIAVPPSTPPPAPASATPAPTQIAQMGYNQAQAAYYQPRNQLTNPQGTPISVAGASKTFSWDPDPDAPYLKEAGMGGGKAEGGAAGGMSQAQKMNVGMGLISQAAHVGDAMKNIGSWQAIASAIPGPDSFKQQPVPNLGGTMRT